MPESTEPANVEALIRADDDQACAEARTDGLALSTFCGIVRPLDLPEDVFAACVTAWFDAYLDSDIAEV